VNTAKASREFNEGLRNIERAVIEGVLRKCGSNIGANAIEIHDSDTILGVAPSSTSCHASWMVW
jgi:hypothetical protein